MVVSTNRVLVDHIQLPMWQAEDARVFDVLGAQAQVPAGR